VVSSVAVTLFLGGWLRPFPNIGWLAIPFNVAFPAILFVGSGALSLTLVRRLKSPAHRYGMVAVAGALALTGAAFLVPVVNSAVIGLFWFLFKVSCMIYMLIWFRGTFPRFRYDQLMNIGWKVAIPVGMAAVMVNALLGMI
jgi:NADH-quinone oxidoreductase subunit H